MLAITADRSRKIQRAARSLRWFFILLSVLLVVGTINQMQHPFPPDSRIVSGVVFHGASITRKIEIVWLVQTILGVAINLKVLYHIIRMLWLYSGGKLFTAQNVSQARQLAFTLMGAPVLWAGVLIAAWQEISAAQDQWTQIIKTFPGAAVIGAGLIQLAGYIVSEARDLRDEQDLVV